MSYREENVPPGFIVFSVLVLIGLFAIAGKWGTSVNWQAETQQVTTQQVVKTTEVPAGDGMASTTEKVVDVTQTVNTGWELLDVPVGHNICVNKTWGGSSVTWIYAGRLGTTQSFSVAVVSKWNGTESAGEHSYQLYFLADAGTAIELDAAYRYEVVAASFEKLSLRRKAK